MGSNPIGGIPLIISSMSREYTAEEGCALFLDQLATIAHFWAKESRATSAVDKCNGVVFSILALLDGCTGEFPACSILLEPHPEDKEFYQENGENWWPEKLDITPRSFHEQWKKYAIRD